MTEEGYDYDFEMTIRSDERYATSAARSAVEATVAAMPDVVPQGSGHYAFRGSQGRWMDITVEARRGDDFTGERLPDGPQVNCVYLKIPASARGRVKEFEALRLAVDLAERLGWTLFDDTDSGQALSRAWLDMHYPTRK